jgi:CRISPR type III-A-associated RAMP protein Csm4
MPLLEIKLRPLGPWRTGYAAGDRERVDPVYHSDAVYSAVTFAMQQLGWLEEWLTATAGSTDQPAVRFGSWFPFVGEQRLAPPPRSAWPPAGAGKLYLEAARLAPLELIYARTVDETKWIVDAVSECVLPVGGTAPFTVHVRSGAAVDRLSGSNEAHHIAALEFAPGAGWWGLIDIVDETWTERVKSAFRLAADSGFGGKRSLGWGRSGDPQFSDASELFATSFAAGDASHWWLLSLYSPDVSDAVDWAAGDYVTLTRRGWTAGAGGVELKKQVRMVAEGSVLLAPKLRGRSVDVAPEGYPHPVYRFGFAFAVPVPAEVVV